jgi:hypothetical protein
MKLGPRERPGERDSVLLYMRRGTGFRKNNDAMLLAPWQQVIFNAAVAEVVTDLREVCAPISPVREVEAEVTRAETG